MSGETSAQFIQLIRGPLGRNAWVGAIAAAAFWGLFYADDVVLHFGQSELRDTRGQVTHASFHQGVFVTQGRQPDVVVRVEYSFVTDDGREYSGRRVAPFATPVARTDPEVIASNLKSSSAIVVRYDPDRPRRNFARSPEWDLDYGRAWAVGIGCSVVALACVLMSVAARRPMIDSGQSR